MKLQNLHTPTVSVSKNITLGTRNFSQGNTPPKLQKWANIILKLGTLGVIVGGAMAAQPFASHLPKDMGLTVMLYSGNISTTFKAISKLFGIKTEE